MRHHVSWKQTWNQRLSRRRSVLSAEALEERRLLTGDLFEPNDTLVQSAQLATGDQTIELLSIHEADNDDWFQWTASADGSLNVSILFSEATGDLDLEVHDANEKLAESISVTDNESVALNVVADETYFIRVLGFGGDVQPEYTLVINGPEPVADLLEPNDSMVNARKLAIGDSVLENLTIHSSNNEDWYHWFASTNGELAVNLMFLHDLGDLTLELFDADGVRFAESASANDNENVLAAVDAGQSYFVRVTGVDGALHRDYSLSVNGPEPQPDRFEPNDSMEAATNLSAGDQINEELTIHEQGNEDWYQWTASSTGTLSARILFEHSLGDLSLELFNDAGEFIDGSDLDNDNENVSGEVIGSRSYFLRVAGGPEALQQDYSLQLEGPEPLADGFEENDSFAVPADLGFGDQERIGLTIHESGNDDWFKWTASNDGTLDVSAEFSHAFGNLDLELYDNNQAIIASSRSTTDNEQLSAEVTAGRKYVLRVFSPEGDLQQNYSIGFDGPEVLPDPFEPNDSATSAADLGSGDQTHIGLTIHESRNEDWYSWTPLHDGPLRVELQFDGTLGDLELELYDSNQQLLDISQTVGNQEQVTSLVVPGETYFIKVVPFSFFLQPDYELTINGPEIQPDAFEANESPENAADLGAGDQNLKELTLHADGDEDWYAWTPISDGSVTVDALFTPSDGNLDLELFDSNQVRLDSSNSLDSVEQVSTNVIGGETYLFHVFSPTGQQHRSYELAINGPGPSPDEFEPNDDMSTAANIGTGDTKRKALSIHIPGNEDWYTWTALLNGTVSFDALFSHDDGNIDLEVYNLGGELLGQSTSTTDNESVELAVNNGQSFFVKIINADGAAQSRYDVVIERIGAAADALEPNNSMAEASDIGFENVAFKGLTIFPAGDQDWIQWTAPAIGTLRVTTLFDPLEEDVIVELVDDTGALLGTSATDPLEGRASIPVTAGQTVFVHAFSSSGESVDGYDLSIQLIESPTITEIADVFTNEDTNIPAIAFTVGDQQWAPEDLLVEASSSNSSLVPDANLHITGTGQDRELTVTVLPDQTGASTISVTVTNPDGNTVTETFDVTINPINDPPRIDSNSEFTVDENRTPVATITATDPENNLPLSYSVSGGADAPAFTIGASSGDLEFITAPDFESPTDSNSDGIYQVAVTVTDSNNASSSQTINVSVADVDEVAPTVTIDSVTPALRSNSVSEITIVFSEAVIGFGLDDLALTRTANEAVDVSLENATLSTSDNVTWTVGNLNDATRASGRYELALVADSSQITDALLNMLETGDETGWTHGAGDANDDGQFDQFDLIAMLQNAKYLTNQPALWSEGDFNLDGRFNQFDVVTMLSTQPPHYLQGPFVATAKSSKPAVQLQPSEDHIAATDAVFAAKA